MILWMRSKSQTSPTFCYAFRLCRTFRRRKTKHQQQRSRNSQDHLRLCRLWTRQAMIANTHTPGVSNLTNFSNSKLNLNCQQATTLHATRSSSFSHVKEKPKKINGADRFRSNGFLRRTRNGWLHARLFHSYLFISYWWSLLTPITSPNPLCICDTMVLFLYLSLSACGEST
jgi:hypothetical protein